MPSSSGQRLRREQGMRCRTSFPLCALVRVFCVRPYSTAALRHGVCETCATFWSTKRHPRPLNGSFFPLRGLTRRAFLLQKGGGGAQKKREIFSPYFTAAAICGAHIGSMTALLRARDLLLVPALPALATPSICWLRSAAASDTLAQHPCSSTAVRATAGSSARASDGSQTLRAACAQPAAQSPGDARTCVSSCGLCWARS